MRMTISQETGDNLVNIHKHEGGRNVKGEKRDGGALCTEAEMRLDCNFYYLFICNKCVYKIYIPFMWGRKTHLWKPEYKLQDWFSISIM